MLLRKKIDKTLANFLVIIMTLMVINVLWQVASRFILGSPSSFTDELARYLMIWIGILGAAYVSCLTAMVIGGSRLVYITYVLEQNSPALHVPLAIVYIVIPISGLLIIYYKISDILKKD